MSLIIIVKVVPASGKDEWKVDAAGRIKAYLKSPPEKGRANQELVKKIAQALNITQQQVLIVSGLTDRTKRIKIDAVITHDQVLSALGLAKQYTIF